MSAARDDARCAALLACFRSEQMSAAQWQGHLREEPGLREYVEEQRAAGNEPTDADLIVRFNATPLVPHHYRLGMLRYVDQGVEPGGFLCAVIDNDLTEAVGRADDEGLAALRDIVRWFYNEAPGPCWGSVDRRLSWVAEHNEKRRREGRRTGAAKGYAGPIEEGMRFLWEGNKAHARCVVRVTGFGEVDGERTIRGIVEQIGPTTISRVGEENWNEESRFREAVAPFGGSRL